MTDNTSNARTVLVTGGGKGLGRAFAIACAKRGYNVVVNNRRRAGAANSAQNVVEEIQTLGGAAVAELSDITSQDAPEAMVDKALSTYGRLDAVIFNAGVKGEPSFFGKTSPEAFEEVMEINFNAQVRLTRAAFAHIWKSKAGRLVYITSSAGMYGVGGLTPYSASKGALIAFAKALASENQKGSVRVNLVAPYATTRMNEDAMPAEIRDRFSPEAAAEPAAWLASEDCQCNGELWVAGAGWVRRGAMIETQGAPVSAFPALASDADALHDLSEAKTYKDAQPAFLDFAKASK